MKIYKRSLWEIPIFWQILFILLVGVFIIIKDSEFRNAILVVGLIGLWNGFKTLWYIGFDDVGMYRFHCFHKGPVDQYKYEEIEAVYVVKYLWSTILVIKKKDGERKNCSLALMNKKDIPVLIEELEQHGVDID